MSASHATVVVGAGDEVVHSLAVSGSNHIRSHVQPLHWKVDLHVDLVAPVPVVREPFQTDDQHLKKSARLGFFAF